MTSPDRSRDSHKALVTGDRREWAGLGRVPGGGSMFDSAVIVISQPEVYHTGTYEVKKIR